MATVLTTAVAAVVLAATAVVPAQGGAGPDRPGGTAGAREAPGVRAAAAPDVVVVLTDDQRKDELAVMPTTRQQVGARGVAFEQAFVVNPWCCPSRASLLTGRYSHGTGVYRNAPPYGGFGSFRDGATLATALDGRGYRTGLVGKYLNGYAGRYVPPGWDSWTSFSGGANEGGAYYDYTLNVDGTLRSYGRAPGDYSTDVLTQAAERFIRTTPAGERLFLLYTPFAPHKEAVPAPRHAGAFAGRSFPRPASVDEADVSDKPAYVRALPRVTAQEQRERDAARRRELETLLSVDEGVGRILDALAEEGRLRTTLVVVTSDHGLLRGEHRLTTKMAPYEESIRVPFLIRYDAAGVTPRVERSRLVTNLDIPVTIAAAAGASLPSSEGRDLAPLLRSASAPWRADFLVEHMKGGQKDPVPTYCATRTATRKYVRYSTGEEELYLLATDPQELRNRAADPSQASVLAAMRSRTRQLCRPTPPGYTFPAG